MVIINKKFAASSALQVSSTVGALGTKQSCQAKIIIAQCCQLTALRIKPPPAIYVNC